MNAENNATPPERGTFQPPNQEAQPVSGQQPVRRAGIMPTSGAQPTTGMPQRTAFRSTGAPSAAGGVSAVPPVSPSAPSANHNAAPTSAPLPTSNYGAQAAQAAQSTPAPTRNAFPTGTVLASSATSAPGAGPAPAAAPGTVAPLAASAAGATATGVTSAGESVADRVKALTGRAKDTTKVQLEKSDKARAVAADSGPRKARVLVSRVDPWSALKIGFLLSIAGGIMLVVAVHILWTVLNSMGVPALAQEWVQRLFSGQQEVNLLQFITYAKVMSATLLVAVVNVVLLTGLATVSALLYNTISRVVGGVYVTLTDD